MDLNKLTTFQLGLHLLKNPQTQVKCQLPARMWTIQITGFPKMWWQLSPCSFRLPTGYPIEDQCLEIYQNLVRWVTLPETDQNTSKKKPAV